MDRPGSDSDKADVGETPGEDGLDRADRMMRPSLLGRSPHIGLIRLGEDLIHDVVALVLMAVAAIVLFTTARDLITTDASIPDAATTAVNGVLFAIILIEVMRTVIAHFERGGLQLQPFLIIGIISAVREVLSVGAKLSLHGAAPGALHDALLELGVNAGVVLGLALALVLIRRFAGMGDPTERTV